jgi:hypothetical protein
LERSTGIVFDGPDFDDNSDETGGYVFIPPDPIGAAGTNILVAVVNVLIEARSKGGILVWRDALQDFFAPVAPANFTFDPKVVYDHYENRFVVVTLEQVGEGVNPHPGNTSRILLAVSKTATPMSATAADWYYHAIDAKESINEWDHWVDYPAFELDEEAIYVLGRMFAHTGGTSSRVVRLWIVDKGVVGGFYSGGPATETKHDPYAAVSLPEYGDRTTMPAQVYGIGGVGPGIGTFLTRYDGISTGDVGGTESLLVIRVDNPIGAVAFTAAFVDVGDIEDVGGEFGLPAVPDAPQLDTDQRIDANDRRILDAVWRNNQLWLTATIVPNSGPDAGDTTAHWFRVDTSVWPPVLSDQGDIGGEDLHPDGGVYTFFPALAVNAAGDAVFGFAASSPAMYCGAYVTGRAAGDAPGTVRGTDTVRAGLDYYIRTFGTPRNRWGDYSGASLDAADDNVFWVFNEYAIERGTPIDDEDGRWGTAWASYVFSPFEPPVLPADPTHQVKKHRYLSIDPSTNPGVNTVIKLEVAEMRRCVGDPRRACLVDEDCDQVCVNDLDKYCTSPGQCGGADCIGTGPCRDIAPDYDPPLSWFVQQPVQQPEGSGCKRPGCPPFDPGKDNCCTDEDWVARLSDQAYIEPSSWQDYDLDGAANTLLHIGDCGVAPCVTYHAFACDPLNPDRCSDPLEISTQRFPALFPFKLYGDVTGGTVMPGPEVLPPDGYVNVADLQVTVFTILYYGSVDKPQAHPTWVDLHGLGTGIPPNYILSVADLMAVYVYGLTDGLPWVNTQGGLDPQDCP